MVVSTILELVQWHSWNDTRRQQNSRHQAHQHVGRHGVADGPTNVRGRNLGLLPWHIVGADTLESEELVDAHLAIMSAHIVPSIRSTSFRDAQAGSFLPMAPLWG